MNRGCLENRFKHLSTVLRVLGSKRTRSRFSKSLVCTPLGVLLKLGAKFRKKRGKELIFLPPNALVQDGTYLARCFPVFVLKMH